MMDRVVCAMLVLALISATAATIPSAMADVEIKKDGTNCCRVTLKGEITVTDAAALNASACPGAIN